METPNEAGFQFQRGFFIVPATFYFVNERAASLLPNSGGTVIRALSSCQRHTADSRKPQETQALRASICLMAST
jgi:hypothetical protein